MAKVNGKLEAVLKGKAKVLRGREKVNPAPTEPGAVGGGVAAPVPRGPSHGHERNGQTVRAQ
jgi:hypothetical protein